MRRVLMIAFHFPPLRGGSGLQRTVSFARYLPSHGWQSLVLSASPRAYERSSDDQLKDLADDLVVRRAFALDAARHLAVGGRYPRLLAVPDRWSSWCLGAVPAGLAMIRAHRPHALWATYPIATAQLIALALARASGLPLIADFRDSMTEPHWPKDRLVWKAYRAIERRVVARSAACVFTAPGARAMYVERYPGTDASRFRVIENGYDEAAFRAAARAPAPPCRAAGPVTVLHSGLVYPAERDPSALLDALASLRDAGRIAAGAFRLVLRASGNERRYRAMIEARALEGIVVLEPALPYREALAEMMRADALLVLQSRGCNHQIPAKLYEYFRARRPVLGLTDADGDTAAALRAAGIDTIADMRDASAIAMLLEAFIERRARGELCAASEAAVDAASREARTRELAELLDEVASGATRARLAPAS